MLFTFTIKRLLQAMRCQTSPGYTSHNHQNTSARSDYGLSAHGGAFYKVSSTLLFWQTDLASCQEVNMVSSANSPHSNADQSTLRGSLSLLWPLFQSLCLSQFVETLLCTLQGRQSVAETGMTLFEHSLAFAEAEAAVASKHGLGLFSLLEPSSDGTLTTSSSLPLSIFSSNKRSASLSRLNTTPETLLVGLVSSSSHLTSQVLGVFGLQGQYRLLSTGFWGLIFMGVLIWGSLTFAPGRPGSIDLLGFPTVCIIGFVPHVLILVGIAICAIIYFMAILLSAFSASTELGIAQSFKDRLTLAKENLQVNTQLSSIRVSRNEDFYSALLKVGFTALTAASEAVFLNEGRPIGVRRWTWLEEERMREVESTRAARHRRGPHIPQDLCTGDGVAVAEGLGLMSESSTIADPRAAGLQGGYAREKGLRKLKLGELGTARMTEYGVGAATRSGRWIMVSELFKGISLLMIRWLAMGFAKLLDRLGMDRKPRWLRRLISREVVDNSRKDPSTQLDRQTLDFWLLSDDGVLTLPEDDQVDVEAEMRRRLQGGQGELRPSQERELDKNIYGWWKNGGWFGELDSSGDFQPDSFDDDTSSICSTSAAEQSSRWDTDDEGNDDGRTTPTRDNPYPRSRESSPIPDFSNNLAHLAQLLNPKTQSERQQAQVLSHHLKHPTPLTRSQYRLALERERTRVLTSTRYRPSGISPSSAQGSSSVDEEAELLEHIILSRRAEQRNSASKTGSKTWAAGAEGLGSDGPQCVVCQTSPRTILVWPCRCLSLCEDCRVSLAMNNFGSCVCCRRDVLGFSRIYVP